MQTINTKTVYYPSFHVGSTPQSIEAQISLVKCMARGNRETVATEKVFLRTPFAMLDATIETSLDSEFAMRGYYATQEECDSYLAKQYPNAGIAQPIMDKLGNAMRHAYGSPMSGADRLAERLEVTSSDIFSIARGDKKHNLKTIQTVLKRLGS